MRYGQHKTLIRRGFAICAHEGSGAIRGVVVGNVAAIRAAKSLEARLTAQARTQRKCEPTCNSPECGAPAYLVRLEEPMSLIAAREDRAARDHPGVNCREPPSARRKAYIT